MRPSTPADSTTNTVAKRSIDPQDEPEARELRELQEKGVGDVASVAWGLGQYVKAEILHALDTTTGLAIRVELSDGATFYLCTGTNLEAVMCDLPREEKTYNEVRIEIPELVLGSPYDLIPEEATPDDIKLLESDAYVGLADGQFVHACVCWYVNELVLKVELANSPIFIFRVTESSYRALAMKIGQDARLPLESVGQVVYVEVPNGVFGDVRDRLPQLSR